MLTDQDHVLRPGVYAPITTPFKDDGSEDILFPEFSADVARLAKANVGIVLGGTLGEGPLLEREERIKLIQTARETIQDLGLNKKIPLISGVVGTSVRECKYQAKEAADAGADAVIVVAPAYFAFVYGKDKAAIKFFFVSIADDSPIPVLIYNIPFAAGGIDLDAEFLIDISEHPNIAGVKLTCGNIAKGHRVALHVNSPEYRSRHPLPFLVMPGSTEYLLPALIGRQHGCIGGPANLYPKVCVRIFELSRDSFETGSFDLLQQAQSLQDQVTEADSVINSVGFLGIKTALGIHVNQGSAMPFRKPLVGVNESSEEKLRHKLAKIIALENSL
ncbi:dihydrodipicolinate synthetase [Penicillium herquei]|nr:dihydrodipicolinate synthetase [Penicillium herquei]